MTLYDGIILTFILVGIIIIIVSFLLSKYDTHIVKEDQKRQEKIVDHKVDYDEVRNKILELNEYGEYLKAELDKKHKELLFLYQMISEKQKEIEAEYPKRTSGNYSNTSNAGQDVLNLITKKTEEDLDKMVDGYETSDKPLDNSKQVKLNFNKEILDLSLAGYSNNEIAKKLKIGKGQVDLVLNLYK